MKKIFLQCLFALSCCAANAQEYLSYPNKNNEMGVELGGIGLAYSAYYSRTFVRSGNVSFFVRAGGGPYQVTSGRKDPDNYRRGTYGLHLMPAVLFTKKHHAWETGLGLAYFNFSEKVQFKSSYPGVYYQDDGIRTFLYLAPQGSYRFYFSRNRLYLRTSVLLGIKLNQSGRYNTTEQPSLVPWAGVGMGFTF